MAVQRLAASWPAGEVLRDISRGGLAGLIVGPLVAGLGGRLVMRLAALLVPSANGSFTENGNQIGELTLAGSVALIVFIGLFAALAFGVVWVVFSPWLPGSHVMKGVVAMPMAVAIGGFGIIKGSNHDFDVLGHSPLVVGSLLLLVAACAPAMALADRWLDRRLPRAESAGSRVGIGYALLAAVGGLLGGLFILQGLSNPLAQPLSITVIAVGIMTLAWWRQRAGGLARPPVPFRVASGSILIAGTVFGYVRLLPEISGALGLP